MVASGLGAYSEGGALGLQDVEGLDVRPSGPDQLVVVVEVLLGERGLPLPGAVYLNDLHHARPVSVHADN